MKLGKLATLGLGGAAALAAISAPALAATPNKGDTAFMFTSTVLVLMMVIPGLTMSRSPLWARVTPLRSPSSIIGVAVVFSRIVTPCF